MEIFSEHFKKDHLFARIDARVKILVAVGLLVMVLSYKGFFFPLLMAALCLLLCIHVKIPVKVFLLRFSEPLFIVLMVTLIKFFFSGHDPLFSFDLPGFTVTGYRDGLLSGLLIGARIIGAVSIVAVLGFTTAFTDLMAGLSWFRVPKGFIEILMLAYRYIFVILEDALVIYNAQKNRLGYTTIKRGLSSFGTLTGSLILKAFESSQSTTLAMIQRGYDGTMPMLQHKPFNASEILCSVLFLLLMGVVWKM
ncbi:MAG: cobalt ECF transporter T component CbiQ [Alphaproteobacteria bacterium]|uniref:Cobalt ECF transporter T component CbiQ n=1 Tax=Candidatus Nitrobium versatile TaxID=2884831 RepID=A0A953J4U2_9BACT|nr:cobalt ECF transporter T component CbiQ [Candidatus Nitrobium versatile]